MLRALLLLALLAPTAAACSLAGPVPPPGAFTLRWPDGDARVVPVEGRLLGGMCELSNKHDLGDGLFAWVEVDQHVSDAPWNVHVLDLGTGKTIVIEDVARASLDAIGVYDRTVLVGWRDWRSPDGPTSVIAIDLDTRERREVDLPDDRYAGLQIEGSRVYALARIGEGEDRIDVYDDKKRAVIARHDVPGPTWIRAASEQWIVVDVPNGGGRMRAVHAEDGGLTELSESGWLVDVDGDAAYFQGSGVATRVRLPGGERATLPAQNWTLRSVHEGVQVHGAYSAPDLNPLGAAWWIAEPTPQRFVLVAALVLAGLAVAGVWAWRRRSM